MPKSVQALVSSISDVVKRMLSMFLRVDYDNAAAMLFMFLRADYDNAVAMLFMFLRADYDNAVAKFTTAAS